MADTNKSNLLVKQAHNITSYTGEDYYDAFFRFIGEESNNSASPLDLAKGKFHAKDKIDDVLVPFISLKLASIERIRSNIDALYQNLKLQSEEKEVLPDRVAGMRIPEIYYGLSMDGRAYYDKVSAICLSSNPVITMQIARLLLKAYPDSTLSEDTTERIAQHYMGGYGPEGVAVAWVESYLTGKIVPEDIASHVSFEATIYSRLPMMWPMSSRVAQKNTKEISLRQAVVQAEYSPFDKLNNKIARSLDKTNSEILSETYNNRSDEYKEQSVEFAYMQFMDKSNHGMNSGNRTLEAMRRLRRKSRYLQALESRSENSGQMTAFLMNCLSVAGVSVDELMDKVISTDDHDLLAAIYHVSNPENFDNAFLGQSDIPNDYLAAGGLIFNTVLALQEARMEAEYYRIKADSKSKNNPSEQAPIVLSSDLKNMQHKLVRMRNEFQTNILTAAKKEKSLQKQLAKKDQEIEELKQKLSMAEETLNAYDSTKHEEGNAGANDADLSVEEIAKVLSQKKIVFVGGHTNWINQIRPYLPNATHIELGAYKKLSRSILSGADVIVYSTIWNEHGMYYACQKMKDKDTPICMIMNTNTDLSLRLIYKTLQEKSSFISLN